ncbi:hypothetical protein Tco_1376971 [Tanacetum coccineum]
MSSMKNLDDTYNFGDQFLYDKLTEDDQEKSKVIEELISSPTTMIHGHLTSIVNYSSDLLIPKMSHILSHRHWNKQHDDASLRFLNDTLPDLIEKYSALPGPGSIKNQESEKSPKEIIRIQKGTRMQTESAKYHLYLALMELYLADEDARIRKLQSTDDHQWLTRNHGSPDAYLLPYTSKSLPHNMGWQITDTRDDVVNSLMHMLPNNIQITDTSLMHMLNLNPSLHKEDSLAADITKALKESKKMSKVDRPLNWRLKLKETGNILRGLDDNAGDDNEETKPDPEEIYK